jgi:hypothetical protein
MVSRNLNARGQGTVGINSKLDRWLAATRAQPSELDEQPLLEQFFNDIGDRLRGQVGATCDLRAPQMFVHPDHFEDDPAVMRTVAFRVGADCHPLAQICLAAIVQV